MEFKRTPQCKKCLQPELRPENRDAIEIWQITADQVIVGGMGAVIGLNQLAVWAAMDNKPRRVKNRWKTFQKVLRLFADIDMEEMRGDGN